MKIPLSWRIWYFKHKNKAGYEVELVTRDQVNDVFTDWYQAAKPIFYLAQKRTDRYKWLNLAGHGGFELKPEIIQWFTDRNVRWKLVMRLAPKLPDGVPDSQRIGDMISVFFFDETDAVEFKLTFL